MVEYKASKMNVIKKGDKIKFEKVKEKEMKTGDKFIIELGEKIKQYHETPDGKQNLIDTVYRIEGANAAITEKDLQNLEEYKKKPTIPREVIEKEGYEKGLNELWETLKQVQNMSLKDYEECTGLIFKYDLYSKITPMELVEKFKEWKEKKAAEEEIKVGDEIESSEQPEKAVVLRIETDGYWGCLQNNQFFTVNDKQKKYWKKTGKHYEEVEKIFQKLKAKEQKFKVGEKVKYKTSGGWQNQGIIEELYENRCLIKLTDKIDGIEYMSISYNDLILDDRKEGEIQFL